MRRALFAAVLVLVSALLGGCWDDRSIEHRAIVLIIGIDQGPDQQLMVHFQVPTSQALSSLSVSSTPSAGTPSAYVVSGTGRTVAEAMTQAQGKVSGDLYLGQTQAIILSSHLPAPQFASVVNFFARMGPMDKTAFVAVTPEPVAQVMQRQPQEGMLAALYLNSLFSCRRCQEVDLTRTVWAMEMRAQAPVTAIWLPLLKDKDANYQVNEVAIYQGGRPVMTLTPEQTVYFGYMINATSKAAMVFPLHGSPVSVRALSSSTSTRVLAQGGGLHLRADLKVQGIVDTLAPGEATLANLRTLQNEVSQGIAIQELALLRSMQQQGVDPVGFMAPYLWQHQELTPKAEALYRSASLEVRVHTRIIGVGDVL